MADFEIEQRFPFRLAKRPAATQVRHRPEPEILAATARPDRDLAGFPDDYADIVDYIVTTGGAHGALREVGPLSGVVSGASTERAP